MDKHPFYFLSRSYSYPEQDTVRQSARALSLLANDLGIKEVTPEEIGNISHRDLQAEYVRLFINAADGISAPPYASVYVGNMGILHQQGYDEALACYNEAGLEPAGTGESPDHIAHELTFVGLLLDEERDDLLQRFLKNHLLLWYPRFFQRLMDTAPHPYYSVLGQVSDLCLKLINKEVIHE